MKFVFLPGLDGTGQLFESILNCLPEPSSTVVVSYPTNQSLDYPALCDLASKSLPKNEEFALIGESFSSPIAIWLAAQKPEMLRNLVLVCGFASNPLKQVAALAPAIAWLPTRGVFARAPSHFLLGVASRSTRERLDKAIESVDPAVIRHRMKQILTLNATESLKHVAVPILYLRASRDRLVSHRSMEEISEFFPELQTKTLDGPHVLLQEKPEESAKEILEFISANRSA